MSRQYFPGSLIGRGAIPRKSIKHIGVGQKPKWQSIPRSSLLRNPLGNEKNVALVTRSRCLALVLLWNIFHPSSFVKLHIVQNVTFVVLSFIPCMKYLIRSLQCTSNKDHAHKEERLDISNKRGDWEGVY